MKSFWTGILLVIWSIAMTLIIPPSTVRPVGPSHVLWLIAVPLPFGVGLGLVLTWWLKKTGRDKIFFR